jgi:anti-anti-sigma factor
MLTTEGTLRVQDHEHEGAHTWVLTGRLSRATAPAFEAALAMLCAQGATQLALDVSSLRFVDSAGLRAISFARECCRGHECEFSLIRISSYNVPDRQPDAAGGGTAPA